MWIRPFLCSERKNMNEARKRRVSAAYGRSSTFFVPERVLKGIISRLSLVHSLPKTVQTKQKGTPLRVCHLFDLSKRLNYASSEKYLMVRTI